MVEKADFGLGRGGEKLCLGITDEVILYSREVEMVFLNDWRDRTTYSSLLWGITSPFILRRNYSPEKQFPTRLIPIDSEGQNDHQELPRLQKKI